MIDFEEDLRIINNLKSKLTELGNSFDINKLEIQLQYLEAQTMEEGFWNDNKKSAKVLTQIKQLKSKCTTYRDLEKQIHEAKELGELAKIEKDEEIIKEIEKDIKKIQNKKPSTPDQAYWLANGI